MRQYVRLSAIITMLGVALVAGSAARAQDEPPADNMCIQCHGTDEVWDANTRHLFVPEAKLASDIHWQKGLRCQDCHGGDATTTDLRSAHASEVGFRKIVTPADVPDFCGHCHSDGEYMKKFRPDAPLDTVTKFWKSAHGQHLKKFAEQLKAAAPPAAAPANIAAPPAAPDAAAPDAAAPAAAATPTEPSDSQTADSEATVAPTAPAEPTTTIDPNSGTAPSTEPPANAAPVDPATTPSLSAAVPAPAVAPLSANHSTELPPASCISCHPVHQMRSTADPLSSVGSRQLAETCGACHQDQLLDLRRSVHAKAGDKNQAGAGTLLDCNKCHGSDSHGMLPVSNAASPMFLDHQVKVCGECHKAYLATYGQSVHGTGLSKSGLLATAVCSDCHGAHGIYYAADKRSTLHPSNVAKSCSKCHYFLAERLASSVHGDKAGAGHTADRAAPGGTQTRKPSCTDCHYGHDPNAPNSPKFRAALPNRCGNCHADLADRYRLSLHGELTEFGYLPAAQCADCHGAHDIRRLTDPESHLAGVNRLETCRKCHSNAVANFAKFDPHASHKDATGYPFLHGAYVWLEKIIYILVGLFALHMLFWFTRSFFYAQRNGRDRPCVAGSRAITSFVKVDRVIYVLLIISFIGLVVTGLPLKYGTYPWAKRLASLVGGFQTTSIFHRSFAVLLLAACATHLVWLVAYVGRRRREGVGWTTLLWGPDSAIPNGRDFRDFLRMIRWFCGLGRKPKFERWAYWEKFDYWAVYAALALIAIPGLMLWFPNFFCLFLPGTVLNLAKLLHAEIAMMAAGFVFMIHVFNTHLRPEKFPLDMSWFTGVVSEEHLIKSRPDFLRRMQAEGKLNALRTTAPDKPEWRKTFVQAFCLLGVGLCVLAVVVLVSLSK